ncbi:unnamed protein product [Schistosoma margrebowiei]|uniref:Uncharacterized protein n=1 Tax=Schistosoma margrebowiei TaxID=48269 RepID=A0A183LVR9_9TREM|nr:unnamed protein product [Schistosoma margrebowiei]
MQLDDSDFEDVLALLFHTHEQMQMKTTSLAAASAAIDLNIHKAKSNILKYNTQDTNPISLDGGALEEVEIITYLGSTIFNRVLLNKMKASVDAQLRDQQAGFRKDRSCIDRIGTSRIIVEQSIEWNSSLYINFIDYEKAFDSVDRTTLRKLLRHYGVPQKIVNIIRNSYDGLNCKIVHGGQLTKSFEVKTGVRQGCLLSPFLFLLVIDWIMKTSTSGGKHGIHCTSRMQLDDLDFADDLALISQTQQQMQEKTTSVAAASAAVGLNIHKGKSKVLLYNTACTDPITLDGEDLEDVKTFTYVGIIIMMYLLIAVYAKYFRSVGKTLSTKIYYGREQTRFQRTKK